MFLLTLDDNIAFRLVLKVAVILGNRWKWQWENIRRRLLTESVQIYLFQYELYTVGCCGLALKVILQTTKYVWLVSAVFWKKVGPKEISTHAAIISIDYIVLCFDVLACDGHCNLGTLDYSWQQIVIEVFTSWTNLIKCLSSGSTKYIINNTKICMHLWCHTWHQTWNKVSQFNVGNQIYFQKFTGSQTSMLINKFTIPSRLLYFPI